MTTPNSKTKEEDKVKPIVQIAHQYIKGTWMQRDLRGTFIRVNGKDISGSKHRQTKSKQDLPNKDSKGIPSKQKKIKSYIKQPLW